MRTLLLILLLVPMMSFGQDNSYSMRISQYEYLTIPSWTPTPSYTLSSWVKFPLPEDTPDMWNTLFVKTMGSHHHIYFGVGGELGSYYADGHYGCGYFENDFSDGFHHIASVAENDSTKFYVDGNLVGSIGLQVIENIDYLGNWYDPTAPTNTSLNQQMGIIDEVTIWGIALSQQEIQNYMNCPPTGNESNLIAYLNFEEGSGTTALDLTSNGNDGTINGATYSTDVPVQNCCTPNPIATQPTNQSVNIATDANISFTDNLTGASYQWQMDSGAGFTNLINAGQFSGSDSQSLTVSSTTMNNNNTLYRCILTESSDCQDTTDVVTLTVVNNVGIGELNNTPKQLIKIVDVLGRKTLFNPNTTLLYIYDDGTVERKMIIE